MKLHRFKSDPAKCEQRIKLIGKGRENYQSGKWTHAFSNQFTDSEPTTENPSPTLFLTISDHKKHPL